MALWPVKGNIIIWALALLSRNNAHLLSAEKAAARGKASARQNPKQHRPVWLENGGNQGLNENNVYFWPVSML